jgi:hypothetical protein
MTTARKYLAYGLLIFGFVILIGCWSYVLRSNHIVWALLAFIALAIIGIRLQWRVIACALILITFLRSISLSYADYLYILPNDFVGKITVVYHPNGPDRFAYAGIWKPHITVSVPPSGLIITSDTKALHHMFNVEDWRYQDGRVIKQYYNKLARGFTFVGSRGAEGRGIREDDPLFKWAVWDRNYYCLNTMNFEVVRKQGDHTDPSSTQ